MTSTPVQSVRLAWVALAVAAGCAGVLLQYGIHTYPLFDDRAYFVCLAQMVARGDSIYAQSFFGYPPLGPLLAAVPMTLGAWIDTPSYLATRYAAWVLAAADVGMLVWITGRAANRIGAGVLAGVALASFGWFGALSVSSLEPKILIVFFTLAACAAVQSERDFQAGLWSSAAALCWQPAAVVAAAVFAVVVFAGRSGLGRRVAQLAAGGAVALLPCLVYLSAQSAWGDFLDRLLGIHAPVQFGGDLASWRWLSISARTYANEVWLLAAALAGLGVATISSLRSRRADRWRFLGREQAGMPLLALAWIAYATVDFQGYADLVPLLPICAFYVGTLGAVIAGVISGGIARLGASGAWSEPAAFAVLALATASYGFADAFRYEPDTTLTEQRDKVEELASRGSIASFGADSVYALSEQAPLFPFLRLSNVFARHLTLVGLRDCAGVRARLVELEPATIVVPEKGAGQCVAMLETIANAAGYVSSVHSWYVMTQGGKSFATRDLVRNDWRIYTHPREGLRRQLPRGPR